MRIYGLTGGTGSGKSTAAKRFAANDIPVVDADVVGHEVIAPGGIAEQAVVEAFGEDIVVGGRIDRKRLGAKVFGDAAALKRLNALVHPAMIREIAARCAALGEARHDAMIIDAALLGDQGKLDPWISGLVLVSCPAEERVRRLVLYRGFTEEEALGRVAAQVDPESKRPLATWIIENTGSLGALHREVDRVCGEIHDANVG